MTDEQESAWWDTCENGARWLVHLLMVLLTWPLWLAGKFAPHAPPSSDPTP